MAFTKTVLASAVLGVCLSISTVAWSTHIVSSCPTSQEKATMHGWKAISDSPRLKGAHFDEAKYWEENDNETAEAICYYTDAWGRSIAYYNDTEINPNEPNSPPWDVTAVPWTCNVDVDSGDCRF